MMNSTMTRDRAIEIARQAAAHEPTRPSYYAEPFEPHEWVIGAILNAVHFAVQERFNATAFSKLVDAWVDFPLEGQVPKGLGEPFQNILNALGEFVGRDEMLKNPEVKRRGEIATAKHNVIWLRDQLMNAQRLNVPRGHSATLHEEEQRIIERLADAEAKARELGIEIKD